MYVSQTICVSGQRSCLQHSLEEQKFRLPARRAAGSELAVHVCGWASPRATARTASTILQLPERRGSGSLLPSHWVLHTYSPLLDPLKSSERLDSNRRWGTANCWTPMGAGWGELSNYAFISKRASYFLGGNCAEEWLPHAWGNHHLVAQD